MKKIFLYTLFVLPLAATAQVNRTKAPKPGPAPVIKIGEPATFTLANGLKVFVVQNTKLPRVSATLTIDREAVLEGDKAGLVGMAGELLRRGTTTMKKAALDEAIDYLGASISTSARSVSGSSLTTNFSKVIGLMSEIVLHPSFPAEELEKIRTQTLSGLAQGKEDPATIARNVTAKLVYGTTHPYGEIESETSVKAVTVADVKKYFSTYWKPNIAYLIFVGDITVEQAKKLATDNFGIWEKGIVPKPNYKTPSLPAKTFIAIVDRPSSVQSNISLVAPIQLQPGSVDAIAANITANLLGGGSSARLYKNLREKYAFTYGAYSSISDDKLVGNFTATAAVRNDKTDSAIGQFIYEFKRLRNELAKVDEVNLIKNERSGAFARRLENPATIAGFALDIAVYNLPKDYYQNYLKNLALVDAAKVKASATKYLPVNNLAIVIVGNAKEIAKGLEKYGTVKYFDVDGNEKAAPVTKAVAADVTAESILQKAANALASNATIAATKDMEMIGIASVMGQSLGFNQKFVFPNNYVQVMTVQGMTMAKQLLKNGSYAQNQQGQDVPLKDDDKEKMDEDGSYFTEAYMLKQKGYTYTIKGIEQVDGKDANIVEIKSPKGRIFTNYYDVASGLLVKNSFTADSPQGNAVVTTVSSAYKAFNGVQVATKVIVDYGQFKINLDITDVKINQGLKVEDLK
jgi:predicted Zn-dependent peptidase